MESMAQQALSPLQTMMDSLSVDGVFGPATMEGDTAVIPVADVMYGFGYGFGGPAETEGPGGSGAGGGGGGRATPRGFIRITPDGVSYTPTNNDTLIAIAGMLTGIWSIFWVAVTIITLIRTVGRSKATGEEAE